LADERQIGARKLKKRGWTAIESGEKVEFAFHPAP